MPSPRVDFTLPQTMDVFRLLTLTYPRYTDSGSRDADKAAGIEPVRRDEARGQIEGEAKLGAAEHCTISVLPRQSHAALNYGGLVRIHRELRSVSKINFLEPSLI